MLMIASVFMPVLAAGQYSQLSDSYKRINTIWGQSGKAYEFQLNEMLKTRSIDLQVLHVYSNSVFKGMTEELKQLEPIKATGKDLAFRNAMMAYCKAANDYFDQLDKMLDRYMQKGTFDKETYLDIERALNSAASRMSSAAKEAEQGNVQASSVVLAGPPATPAIPAGPAALIRFSVKDASGKNEKFGMRESSGKIIIPAVYDWISSSINYTPDERDEANQAGYFIRKADKEGFISPSGKVIIPPIYQLVGHLSEGRFFIGSKGKFGFADENGKAVIPLKYYYDDSEDEGSSLHTEIRYFRNGFARVSLAGNWGLINKAGVAVVPLKYDEVSDFESGYAMVKNSAGTGFVNTKGVMVVKPAAREVMGHIYNGAVMLKQDNKYFILDIASGTQTRVPYTEVIYGFNEWGLALVESHGLSGFINHKGQTVIEAIYDFPTKDFQSGMITLTRGRSDYCALFDSTGRAVTSARYDFIGKFRNGIAPFQLNGKYGLINKKGEEVQEAVYDFMGDYSNGRACVGRRSYGSATYGFIDESGKVVIPLIYDKMGNFMNGKAAMTRNGRDFEIDTQGQTIK